VVRFVQSTLTEYIVEALRHDWPLHVGMLLLALWTALGMAYGILWYDFTVIQSLYFAISTMATGGLQVGPWQRRPGGGA
jgi:hypothetical protein